METIRIPTRYKRSISRLSDKEKAWILMSLFELSEGNDILLLDSSAGDVLEQVWRDAVMMEKKNKHNSNFVGGDCVASNDALTTESRRAVKGSEVKGSEVKGSEYIVEQVVEILNKYAKKNFSSKNKSLISLISARQKESRTLQDFENVIKIKCKEWKGTEMEKYLRPETLFGSKFESYLNQVPAKKQEQIEKIYIPEYLK